MASPILQKFSNGSLSQSEILSRLDKTGKVAPIVEILNQTNEILQHVTWQECNEINGHSFVKRTSLPEAYVKRINQGVLPSKSSTAVQRETCGRFQARFEMDSDLLENKLNGKEARLSEEYPFIEAMGQKMVKTFFYGQQHLEAFDGFATRYNSLDKKKNPNARNVIDCGGTGDNLTSIYIVGWGPQTVFGIYPQGSPMGLQVTDLGCQTIFEPDGTRREVYSTKYDWTGGLCVKDDRYVVRLANISVEDLRNGTGIGSPDLKQANSNNLLLMLQRGLDKIYGLTSANICIYMNADVHSAFNTLALRSNSNFLRVKENNNEFGDHQSWTTFNGFNLYRVDQISATEKQVV